MSLSYASDSSFHVVRHSDESIWGAAEEHAENRTDWRGRLLSWVYVWTAILGFVPATFCVVRMLEEYAGAALVGVVAYLALVYGAIRKSLKFDARAILLLGTFYVGATVSFYDNGITSLGPVLLFGFVAFSSVLLDRRWSAASIMISVATVIAFGLLFSGGWIEAPDSNSQLGVLWIRRGLVVGIVASGVVISVTYLITSLEASLDRSRELALRLGKNQAMLSRVQEIAGIGAWEWDAESQQITRSDQLYRILGRDRTECEQMRWSDFLHPADHRTLRQLIDRAKVDGTASGRLRILKPDGSACFIRLEAEAEFHSDGRVNRITGFTKDLSDEIADEEKRASLESQLLQSQKLEAIGKLASGVAHDFNNLLLVITGYGDIILRRGEVGEVTRHAATQIQSAADRAANLTRNLLAFSRNQALRPEVLDLNGLVSGLERMLNRLLGKAINLQVELDPLAGYIEADPGQLEQAIVNLVVNASDAMQSGGDVHITTGTVERAQVNGGDSTITYTSLSVSDAGSGIDTDLQQKVFDPFFTTKDPGQGAGLGLSMVYGFAQQSGGLTDVTSKPGEGSTFQILLPRVDGETPQEGCEPLAASLETSLGRTILLVEDEPRTRRLIRIILESGGHTILEAPNGPAAIKIAEEYGQPIDAVVSEAVTPGMTGAELGELVREKWPGLRILLLSAHPDPVLPEGALCLQKPFQSSDLIEMLHRVLELG